MILYVEFKHRETLTTKVTAASSTTSLFTIATYWFKGFAVTCFAPLSQIRSQQPLDLTSKQSDNVV